LNDKSANDLEATRRRLDEVDDAILERLADRRALVRRVLEIKERGGLELRDGSREDTLVGRLSDRATKRGLDRLLVERVYREILADSRRLQAEILVDHQNDIARSARVVFAGLVGSYSEQASRQHFASLGDRVLFEGTRGFHEVAEAVVSGRADFGVLPIENTTAGSINETYDLLRDAQLSIVGEEIFTVEHCLLGLPDAGMHDVRQVVSHPQALTQCDRFLHALNNAERVPAIDTADAARSVRDAGDPTRAAIASRRAAELYDLIVLEEGIADRHDNFTRFVVLGRQPLTVDTRIPCRTSLVLATRHDHGALAKVLHLFAAHGLNLTKLESRPQPGVAWEYLFYLDFEGNSATPVVAEALDDIAGRVSFVKVLGSYPQADRRGGRTDVITPTIPRRVQPQVTPAPPRPRGGRKGRLVSRESRAEDSRVTVGNVMVGGDEGFCVIAGPCSVESREQIFTAARVVQAAGAHILRGGCFKPRTSPYSFQGLGWEGLDLLCEAGRAYGLPVVTEVLAETDVQEVARRADMIQVGARNMQNFTLLREVGRVQRPVLLKRGMMASIEELLNAAEYILAEGNQDVILCERGIRTFETATRNTLDIAAVPALRERTHLPVIVDPSHACGVPQYVMPLTRAAAAVGAHGVMIEVHANPKEALSDKDQALIPAELEDLMGNLSQSNTGRPPPPAPRPAESA
jgi:chorismate mutase/prephenate dehydratase